MLDLQYTSTRKLLKRCLVLPQTNAHQLPPSAIHLCSQHFYFNRRLYLEYVSEAAANNALLLLKRLNFTVWKLKSPDYRFMRCLQYTRQRAYTRENRGFSAADYKEFGLKLNFLRINHRPFFQVIEEKKMWLKRERALLNQHQYGMNTQRDVEFMINDFLNTSIGDTVDFLTSVFYHY